MLNGSESTEGYIIFSHLHSADYEWEWAISLICQYKSLFVMIMHMGKIFLIILINKHSHVKNNDSLHDCVLLLSD